MWITFFLASAVLLAALSGLTAFHVPAIRFGRALSMSTTVPPVKPSTNKVEGTKTRSNYLSAPLTEEIGNDEIFLTNDAMIVMKYHGSYQQDNRDMRKRGEEKQYQFMLRLKVPAGEVPPALHLKLDEMADQFGQGDLRLTTRQAYQMHGILKGDLKSVISEIMQAGSSTVGACGDVSRNVMCPSAPFSAPQYKHARHWSKIMAELFKPQAPAVIDLWDGEEKVAGIEYWLNDIKNTDPSLDVHAAMLKDTGLGVITKDTTEPLYGQQYLPKKFKIAVTVPGDNSLDLYINDVGLVVITDDKGELEGFNVMVGGGMGRTHNKESTFARAADHFGFVSKEDCMELTKCIVAAQRDHGNREIRANARMKYLVHNLGVDSFRTLVEGYFGKKIQPWREIEEWKYNDWMGWHEQGDGKMFLGLNVEQGRIRDYGESEDKYPEMGALKNVKMRSAVHKIVKEYQLTTVLSPTQSVFFKDVDPKDRPAIDAILKAHGVKSIEETDPLVRLSMACPAMPLCGLAVTEAERRMPDFNIKVRGLLDKLGLGQEQIMMRMTGCPNGCARPYMAEMALVGDGPDMYQVWVGGSPVLTNVAEVYRDKVKYVNIEATLEPLLAYWGQSRQPGEAFGSFTHRVGVADLEAFSETYVAQA
ncbi:hypothetical protein B484DRAFT_448123 [Ochromonadaceae sp. CCMP2298]|nr:hypothetical protein B484DRAFT_448123 [Ochromonadaceae sp. CCMP2298]|mmetsp:Transcript_21410/g.47541  ORF Transcript_21410/g.47541 Transcript_21410/m.47541 type:complete len:645 (+) Transcript_21410:160-2094(+)